MAVERGFKLEELEEATRTVVKIEEDAFETPLSQGGWRKRLVGVVFLLVGAVATVGIGPAVWKPNNTVTSGDRRLASSDGPKTSNGCPQNMPTLYPGTHRCFQSGPIVNGGPGGHWGGAMCNLDPATDPAPHHRNDRKCVYDIPATDGPKTSNGCPQNMPTLYPGTHRCFQSGPIVNGGPGGHWGGAMCNLDPATDPAPHHRNDRKCVYDNQVNWMVAPRDCQTCDEVCTGRGQVCEAGHLYPIQNETEVKKTAAMAGFTCTHYYRETWSVSAWDGPLLRLNSGLCVYNGNPNWKPSCSAKPACGYGHRLCPCKA